MKTPVPYHIDYFLGKRALKKIQSAEDNWMYQDVTLAALHMATAGYLEEANELLECLWKHKWPHTEDVWLPDQSFEVLWYADGNRPVSAPFASKPIDIIELAHRKYCASEHRLGSYRMQRGPDFTWEMLPPGFRSAYLASALDDVMPSASLELQALAGLEEYLESWNGNVADMFYGDASCLAAELAAKIGRTERAIHFAQLWARKYPEFPLGYNFPCMSSNRHVAPFLLQGILSEAIGLTKVCCQSYLKNLKAAVDARMKRGRKLAYGKWTWEKLLTSAGKRAIKGEPDLFTKEERKSKWLGRQPATDAEIVAAEKRMDLKLPPDYVGFLRASNGLSALSSTAPPLLDVGRIGWLRDAVDSATLDILKDYPGENLSEAIESSILVSELKESDMVLLVPPRPNEDQWQCWFLAHWVPGEIRYPSFRHYVEEVFQNSQTETVA